MSPERKEEYRWQFAGRAMQGLLCSIKIVDLPTLAKGSVGCADALIAALEASEPKAEVETTLMGEPVTMTPQFAKQLAELSAKWEKDKPKAECEHDFIDVCTWDESLDRCEWQLCEKCGATR